MSQQLTSAPVVAKRKRRLWRFIFPAFLLLVMISVFLIVPIGSKLGFEIGTLMDVVVTASMALPICVILLLVWFVAFSGFRWYTRVAGLFVLAILVGAYLACVRKLEFSAEMQPIAISFRWEPNEEEEFERFRSQQPKHELPSLNLSIDPASDFPRYRGLNADGVVLLPNLETNWLAHPPKTRWPMHPCGGGYSGFAVAGDVAITLEQRRGDEAVVCYDRKTGDELWEYRYEARFHRSEPMGGDGPRATPTIDGGEVFSLGAEGRLVCLDGKNGKEKWSANILEDNGAKNVEWGMSGSPLVVDNLVIVNPGIDATDNVEKALVAYDRSTGKPVWQSGKYAAGYSSPQLATVAGVEQVLLFDVGGLAGFDPKTGKELWRHPWTTYMGMNIIQPVVIGGDRVFIASEPTGCALLHVQRADGAFKVEQVWLNRNIGMKFSNPIALNGFIYGLSYGKLVCIDAETGKPRWEGAEYGAGQLLLAGNVLVVTEEKKGDLALVAAKPDGFDELAHIEVLKGKTWNTPALAGRELFMRNHKQMTCLELPLVEK
jgi:outer membrane protein assembly factor BamB